MVKKTSKELSKEELEWQAESDARIIANYNEIINDKARLARALKAAQREVDNLTERADALNKSITGIKSKK
jgi:hypothetical protein